MMTMQAGNTHLKKKKRQASRKLPRDGMQFKGRLDILVFKKEGNEKHLIDYQTHKNIIFIQGYGQILNAISSAPVTVPAVINRMCVGDQGTIPSSAITPKVPTSNLPQSIQTTGLYHEVYRQDVNSRTITINPGTPIAISGTLAMGFDTVTVSSTVGIVIGMPISGPGIPANATVTNITSSTAFTFGPGTASLNGAQSLTLSAPPTLLCTVTAGLTIITTTSTALVAEGMGVSGTGIQGGSVVASVNSTTQFTISSPVIGAGTFASTLTLTGAANQAQFVAEFGSIDIALSAFSNPSNPVVNEVGLVLINPGASSGISRTAVTAPATPPPDEVVMSIRCFPSIPLSDVSVSVTIRYTIYMES